MINFSFPKIRHCYPNIRFHCLTPERCLETNIDLYQRDLAIKDRRIISEFVGDLICKEDKNFAREYIERLFDFQSDVHPLQEYYPRAKSGWVRIYTPQYITYFIEGKGWKRISNPEKLELSLKNYLNPNETY